MKIVEVNSLVKVYSSPFLRRKTIGVNGLDLEIEEEEIFGLLGPNGAGKTTLLKTMVGLLKPTSGNISLFGGIDSLKAREKIGYLPENPTFYQHLTGLELLSLYSRLYGIRKDTDYLSEIINKVGIKSYVNKRISGYSKGMIQRLGFAQSLVGNPELLILDEPLSGLDPLGRRELKELIVDINKRGVTVIFSSHILSDVETICSRVGIILNGEMKRSGNLGEILKSDIRYTEIEIFSLIDYEWLDSYGELRFEGEILYLKLKDESKREDIIERVIKEGGNILSVTPVKLSLEDHFIRTVNE